MVQIIQKMRVTIKKMDNKQNKKNLLQKDLA
jgi:hypothetical protein